MYHVILFSAEADRAKFEKALRSPVVDSPEQADNKKSLEKLMKAPFGKAFLKKMSEMSEESKSRSRGYSSCPRVDTFTCFFVPFIDTDFLIKSIKIIRFAPTCKQS